MLDGISEEARIGGEYSTDATGVCTSLRRLFAKIRVSQCNGRCCNKDRSRSLTDLAELLVLGERDNSIPTLDLGSIRVMFLAFHVEPDPPCLAKW